MGQFGMRELYDISYENRGLWIHMLPDVAVAMTEAIPNVRGQAELTAEFGLEPFFLQIPGTSGFGYGGVLRWNNPRLNGEGTATICCPFPTRNGLFDEVHDRRMIATSASLHIIFMALRSLLGSEDELSTRHHFFVDAMTTSASRNCSGMEVLAPIRFLVNLNQVRAAAAAQAQHAMQEAALRLYGEGGPRDGCYVTVDQTDIMIGVPGTGMLHRIGWKNFGGTECICLSTTNVDQARHRLLMLTGLAALSQAVHAQM